MSELCKFCGEEYSSHCPDCSCCGYDDGECENSYCEADLIDRGE